MDILVLMKFGIVSFGKHAFRIKTHLNSFNDYHYSAQNIRYYNLALLSKVVSELNENSSHLSLFFISHTQNKTHTNIDSGDSFINAKT